MRKRSRKGRRGNSKTKRKMTRTDVRNDGNNGTKTSRIKRNGRIRDEGTGENTEVERHGETETDRETGRDRHR